MGNSSTEKSELEVTAIHRVETTVLYLDLP